MKKLEQIIEAKDREIERLKEQLKIHVADGTSARLQLDREREEMDEQIKEAHAQGREDGLEEAAELMQAGLKSTRIPAYERHAEKIRALKKTPIQAAKCEGCVKNEKEIEDLVKVLNKTKEDLLNAEAAYEVAEGVIEDIRKELPEGRRVGHIAEHVGQLRQEFSQAISDRDEAREDAVIWKKQYNKLHSKLKQKLVSILLDLERKHVDASTTQAENPITIGPKA